MRICKVRITKEERISMVYEESNIKADYDEFSFTCADEAMPTFYDALCALAEHVVDMCELPSSYIERIRVRGVTFAYSGDNETMGASISAQLLLDKSNCDLNLNTPFKAEDSYSDSPADPMQLLSPPCIKALYTLMDECKLYIRGERAQCDLFARSSATPKQSEPVSA